MNPEITEIKIESVSLNGYFLAYDIIPLLTKKISLLLKRSLFYNYIFKLKFNLFDIINSS